MNYQSATFLIFSAVVLAIYYLFPGKLQKYVLLVANISFYYIAGIEYIPYLLATMLATFFGGRIMGKIYETEKAKLKLCENVAEKKKVRALSKRKARIVLFFTLLVAVGLLVVSKYTMFILSNVNMFVTIPSLDTFKIIVPLGVSFYTFMAIGYILDIYWKRYTAEKNFAVYATFLSYFPHIVQGPIDRFNEFKAQLPIDKKVKFDGATLTSGAQLVIWGFFKKLVIADTLGVFVNSIYDSYQNYYGVILAVATIAYSIQIYADFSGCIDIVSGVSEMFGIKLRKNFDHPYFSKTMPEFWRRWHISLGQWFTDYIYYPVSVGKLVKKVKKNKINKRFGELFASCFPVAVVWMITGIWHGAAWKFVAWGVFHAILIILSIVFERINEKTTKVLRIRTDCFSWELWQMFRTFTLCCIGRVFFRASSLSASLDIFKNIFASFKSLDFGISFIKPSAIFNNYGLTKDQIIFLALAILVLLAVDIMQEKMKLRETLAKQNLIYRWAIVIAAILVVLVFGMYGPGYDASSFIYEQF